MKNFDHGSVMIPINSEYMSSELNKNWSDHLKVFTHAFQPIVSTYSGVILGYEALLRNSEMAGFESIGDVFDTAAKQRCLFAVDMELRKKALDKFSQIQGSKDFKLFYNIDNRIVEMPDFQVGLTKSKLNMFDYDTNNFVFEISEKHNFENHEKTREVLEVYKRQGYNVALDDFGNGYSGLKYFYNFEPNYIKIDRFFVHDMPHNNTKKVIVSGIVKIAKKLGIKIIAEGIETENEYYICKDLGCDYVQGYLIQKPCVDTKKLKNEYSVVVKLNSREKRQTISDRSIIKNNLEFFEPVYSQTHFRELFEKIKKTKELSTLPIVNKHMEPEGVVLEMHLRKYVYSMYGVDLLFNKSYGKSITDFITKYPIMDIRSKLEDFIETLSTAGENVDFIIVVEDGKYKGLLNARSLLKAVNEKNLDFARSMNPLTKLPGNKIISEFITNSSASKTNAFFIYFDFDDFKPFNDKYGFRRGDRAIMIFGDIMRSHFLYDNQLIGHIGGDDFFVGIRNDSFDKIIHSVQECVTEFNSAAKDLYEQNDKESGYIIAEDRYGEIRNFPLLTVSSLVIEIPGNTSINMKRLDDLISFLKHSSKKTKSADIPSATYMPHIPSYISKILYY